MDLHNHYIIFLIYISVCTHRQNERAREGFSMLYLRRIFKQFASFGFSLSTASIKHKKDMYKRQGKRSKQKENKVAKC